MECRLALKHVPFLKGLPDEVIDVICAAGRQRTLRKGECLFTEGSACLGLIVVLAGAIKLYKVDHRGRELTLGAERFGGSVAELPLFDGGNYPASAEAVEDASAVLIVPPADFRRLLVEYTQISEQALRMMAIRMRRLIQMVEAQTLHTVRVRLAAYLLRASSEKDSFHLGETNEAIGNAIGTVRDVVSRTLSGFKDDGIITLRGRWVSIDNFDSLRRIADAGGSIEQAE